MDAHLRCKACDRADCDEAETGAAYTRIMNDFQAGGGAFTQVQWGEALTRHAIAFEACRAAKVDWRARCQAAEARAEELWLAIADHLPSYCAPSITERVAMAGRALAAAESEALASRALLREVNCGPLRGVTQDVADRIRDHLAGKP